MKKLRRIHMWIGIIATVFLLIESTTGIIMYLDGGDKRGGVERTFRMNGTTSSVKNWTAPNGQAITNSQSTDNSGSGPGRFGGAGGQFPARGGGGSSLNTNVRSLHEGVVGLISGIGMFLLAGTGVVMSIMIWRANRKKNKRGTNKPDTQVIIIDPVN